MRVGGRPSSLRQRTLPADPTALRTSGPEQESGVPWDRFTLGPSVSAVGEQDRASRHGTTHGFMAPDRWGRSLRRSVPGERISSRPSPASPRAGQHAVGSSWSSAMTSSDGSTGLELLREVAGVLEAVSHACENDEDGERLADLAARLRAYLAASRPTTPLGMPAIQSQPHTLTEDEVVRVASRSHIRILER